MYALIVLVLANFSDGGSAATSVSGFESYELCSAAKQRVEKHFSSLQPKLDGGAFNIVSAECVRVKQ